MPVCQSCPVRPDIGAHACRGPRHVLLRTSARRPPRRARQAQPRQCGGFGAAHLDDGEYVRRPRPGCARLHRIYRPLGSCSRAARWNAATLCIGPSRPIAPPKSSVANRGIAEIDRPRSIAEGDAYDPTPTSVGFSRVHQSFWSRQSVSVRRGSCPYLPPCTPLMRFLDARRGSREVKRSETQRDPRATA